MSYDAIMSHVGTFVRGTFMLQVENLEFQLAAANASVEHSRSHNAALQARIR